jgi:hypothetical protein
MFLWKNLACGIAAEILVASVVSNMTGAFAAHQA